MTLIVTLVDSSRPMTYVNDDGYGQFFSLQLPRRSLVSHLGFEPRYGSYGGGKTHAGRLLFQLVLDAVEDEDSRLAPGSAYMPLAVYDLLGAQFAPSDPMPFYSEKLFGRVCNIIKDRFSDPQLGPCEVATEAGICCATFRSSLRRGTLPAPILYILFAWIMPRVGQVRTSRLFGSCNASYRRAGHRQWWLYDAVLPDFPLGKRPRRIVLCLPEGDTLSTHRSSK